MVALGFPCPGQMMQPQVPEAPSACKQCLHDITLLAYIGQAEAMGEVVVMVDGEGEMEGWW